MNEYAQQLTVSQAIPSERATFICRTYAHLAAAVLLFIGLETYLINSPLIDVMIKLISTRFGWLTILISFLIIGNLAALLAVSNASPSIQYIGLTLYVILEAIIFLPLIWFVAHKGGQTVLPTATIMTLLLFLGLTAVVFTTKKDFSFLGSILMIGGLLIFGLIICAILFGFNLGLIFSFFMIFFAAGAILYDTSNVLHRYQPTEYVGAALQLFASIALLFWYLIQILMSRD